MTVPGAEMYMKFSTLCARWCLFMGLQINR